MDVTVVIPNYNGINYIGDCLDSLLAGSVTPGILVVDNGSSDGSADYIEERYPAVRLVRFAHNRGFSAGVNEGIRLADTEFILLLNNDTRADRLCVENLYRAIRRGPDIFSVGAKLLSMRNPNQIDDAGDLYCALGWAFARGKGREHSLYDAPGPVFAACAGAAIYRKSLLERVGFFDPNHFAYLEDIDIGYRARILGFRNLYEPTAIVLHAGSAVSGSRHNAFKVELSAANSLYVVYKNMPWPQILLNLPFLTAGVLIKAAFFTAKGMGRAYGAGLRKGFRLCASSSGREHRVKFRLCNLSAYVRIQWELWKNLLLLLRG